MYTNCALSSSGNYYTIRGLNLFLISNIYAVIFIHCKNFCIPIKSFKFNHLPRYFYIYSQMIVLRSCVLCNIFGFRFLILRLFFNNFFYLNRCNGFVGFSFNYFIYFCGNWIFYLLLFLLWFMNFFNLFSLELSS